MQYSMYSTPLHGVECCLPGNTPARSGLKQLAVCFAEVNLPKQLTPIWSRCDSGQRYSSQLALFRTQSGYILQVDCEGQGRFAITPEQISIDWHGGTSSEHYFQSIAIALWLELQQIPCVHANALQYKGHTFALMAASGTGKSTLSMQLQQQHCSWLSDDMMALHPSSANDPVNAGYQVYPSWPVARLWPDSVAHTSQYTADKLPKVHQRFAKRVLELPVTDCNKDENSNLSCIYLLNRVDANPAHTQRACEIRDVDASQALILLLQHSMLGNAYCALGLEARRMAFFSALVQTVKVKQVTYLSGKANLAQVSHTILEELDCA